jgi:hypothetical protein
MCPHTGAVEENAAIIAELLYMCPHIAIYMSSYCCICVGILLYTCPHTGAVEENAAIIAELMPGKPTPVEVLDFTCFTGTKCTCCTSTKADARQATPVEILTLLALLVPKYKY